MSLDFLLAGALGALLVFFLGVLREWWREENERRGLLILLLAELEHNAEVIRTIFDRMNAGQAMEDLIAHPHFANQKARTWDNVQERAAARSDGGAGRILRSARDAADPRALP